MSRYIDAEELIKGRGSNDPVVIAAKCAPAADVTPAANVAPAAGKKGLKL